MRRIRRALVLLVVAIGCTLGGCGGPSSSSTSSDQQPDSSVSTVTGRVVVRSTGRPYAGAIVEFKNVVGGNLHTTTNGKGEYSIRLPADVYTALALDLDNTNAGFDVVGGGPNTVEVPPSTRVDFEAYEINPGREPVG